HQGIIFVRGPWSFLLGPMSMLLGPGPAVPHRWPLRVLGYQSALIGFAASIDPRSLPADPPGSGAPGSRSRPHDRTDHRPGTQAEGPRTEPCSPLEARRRIEAMDAHLITIPLAASPMRLGRGAPLAVFLLLVACQVPGRAREETLERPDGRRIEGRIGG